MGFSVLYFLVACVYTNQLVLVMPNKQSVNMGGVVYYWRPAGLAGVMFFPKAVVIPYQK